MKLHEIHQNVIEGESKTAAAGVKAALGAAGVRQQLKILVGGAPVTRQFANEIGADDYAAYASQAVAVAKQVLQVM
jgi:methanogenic corrinoid protein MtbC1